MPLKPKSFQKFASETNPIKVMLDLYGAYQFSVFRHHFNLLVKMAKDIPFDSKMKNTEEAIRQWFRDSLSSKVLNEEQFQDLNTILDILENKASVSAMDDFYNKFKFDESFADDEEHDVVMPKPNRLGGICEIKINFPDADFWLVRKNSIENVGKPVKEFNTENIGIKVKEEFLDRIDPRYLYYWFYNLYNLGAFQSIALGSTRLANIKLEDIKKIQIEL